MHMCEAFLGIDPHFHLFRHLFCLKITSATNSRCVGRAGIQFKQGMRALYIPYTLKESAKDWYSDWFYVTNPDPKLREQTGLPPHKKDHWFSNPPIHEQARIQELMTM